MEELSNKIKAYYLETWGWRKKKHPKVLKEFATGELSLGLARCMAYRGYDDCFSICFIVLFNFLIYMHILLWNF